MALFSEDGPGQEPQEQIANDKAELRIEKLEAEIARLKELPENLISRLNMIKGLAVKNPKIHAACAEAIERYQP